MRNAAQNNSEYLTKPTMEGSDVLRGWGDRRWTRWTGDRKLEVAEEKWHDDKNNAEAQSMISNKF